ncbi:hypothetical protein Droror1_Dr00025264 [Drosera rotundifolia]
MRSLLLLLLLLLLLSAFASASASVPVPIAAAAVFTSMMSGLTSATVFAVIGKNASIAFEDIAANFAPPVNPSGLYQIWLNELQT